MVIITSFTAQIIYSAYGYNSIISKEPQAVYSAGAETKLRFIQGDSYRDKRTFTVVVTAVKEKKAGGSRVILTRPLSFIFCRIFTEAVKCISVF
jgi:hypothetical protein